ncbi:50S ribosomal protein L24 [Candidatus Woesearchaeota archaeon]|nr:50S ribosomal protein L24 [Candidatus Woesearchaeota archaeon]
MKNTFSTSWKSSKRPAKQRKYRHNAPLHIKQKLLSAHLSKDLRKRYGRRSLPVVKGDKVKVARGQFKGRENKVERTDHKKLRVYITGIERAKKEGSKSMQPINPSNLIITELNLDDKKRKASLEKSKPSAKPKAQKPEEGK